MTPKGDLVVVIKGYWDNGWRIDYDDPSPQFSAYVSLGMYCTDFLNKMGFKLIGDL